MSKWKCGICNREFENYHAQGFDNIIYCPLCYYKELYKRDKKEIERLNNIINKLEKWLEENIKLTKTAVHFEILDDYDTRKYKRDIALFEMVLDKLKALKENNKDAC